MRICGILVWGSSPAVNSSGSKKVPSYCFKVTQRTEFKADRVAGNLVGIFWKWESCKRSETQNLSNRESQQRNENYNKKEPRISGFSSDMQRACELSSLSLQQEKSSTNLKITFLEPSENWDHRTNCHPKIWRKVNSESHS